MELWMAGVFLGQDEGWVLRLLGRFHPLVVHFPIALLVTVALMDGWRLLRGRKAPGPVVQILLFLGAAGAVVSAALGWASGAFEKSEGTILALHRWLGTSVAIVAVFASLCTFRARRMRSRPSIWIYRLSLWVTVALVGIASHYGGMLVYGEGYLESALPSAAPAEKKVALSMDPSPSPTGIDFHRDIEPVLRKHCVKCHGPEKVKGKLRLDTRELAMKGGVSGPAIVPGNGRKSLLYTLLLEEDPDSRMPTKEKSLSPEQIEAVRAWIDQGALWPEPVKDRSQGKTDH